MVVGIPAAPVAAAISVVITIAGRGAATGEGGRGDERGEQEPVHMMSPCGCERERRQGFGQETRERRGGSRVTGRLTLGPAARRSEEHTYALQSLMHHSSAVFRLKKKIATNPST